jgi:two-component system OmpR family response regulator
MAIGAITPIAVLVVKDDPSMSSRASLHLRRHAAFVVHEVQSADEAIRVASEGWPDVVILDMQTDDGPGTIVCERLRASSETEDLPILALAARNDVATRVGLLELGCDDCLAKPCEADELIARVHVLVRRRRNGGHVRRIGPLRVQLISGDAWIGSRALELTAGERAILSTLVRAYPSVAHRAALDRLPWRAADDVSSNVTEVLVARLRQKLAAAGGGVEIRTVRRTGYRVLTADATESGA